MKLIPLFRRVDAVFLCENGTLTREAVVAMAEVYDKDADFTTFEFVHANYEGWIDYAKAKNLLGYEYDGNEEDWGWHEQVKQMKEEEKRKREEERRRLYPDMQKKAT